MGRIDNWGHEPLKRAKRLIEFLLSYQKCEADSLRIEWQDQSSDRPKLFVTTKLIELALLMNQKCIKSRYDSQLKKEKEEIQNTIDRLKNLKIILEDSMNHEKYRGIRRFTLILWHSSNVQENLIRLETAWRNRSKFEKSQDQTTSLKEAEVSLTHQTNMASTIPYSGANLEQLFRRSQESKSLHQQLLKRDIGNNGYLSLEESIDAQNELSHANSR